MYSKQILPQAFFHFLKTMIIAVLVLQGTSVVAQSSECSHKVFDQSEVLAMENAIQLPKASVSDIACNKIRVVVHVIYDSNASTSTSGQISREQVKSQIRISNQFFRNDSLMYDADNTPLGYELVLATHDPNGNSTDGIIYHDGVALFGNAWSTYGLQNDDNNAISESTVANAIAWGQDANGNKYLNSYVVNKIDGNNGGGTQAYAYFPTSNNIYGNYNLYNAYGSEELEDEYGQTFQLKSYTDLGYTWTHELMHNFALFHTFHGNSCAPETNSNIQGDRVTDTPPQTQGFGCSGSCGFLSNNVMDYLSQSCKSKITPGQVNRMHLAINNNLLAYLVCSDENPDPCSDTESTHDAVACGSYNWNGTNYYESGNYFAGPFTNSEGCDSTAYLNLTINLPETYEFAVYSCDSYTWDGTSYYSSGNFVKTFQNEKGCDSTVTMNLHISNNSSTSNITKCDAYFWNGTEYTESGNYTAGPFTNTAGCDSIANLILTITESNATEFSVAACESYTWDGTTYETTGDFAKTYDNIFGCDSVVTLHLSIHFTTSSIRYITECVSYYWNGTKYSESGNYSDGPYTNVLGCDSIAYLNLTINYPDETEFNASSCDFYSWDGTTYETSGDFVKSYDNIFGCDSTVTMHLSILNNSSTKDKTACDSFFWNGSEYTESGNYEAGPFTNAAGCDSIAYLNLEVNYSNEINISAVNCESYNWDGTLFTESGDYTKNYFNQFGCDSIVNMHLTILNASSSNENISSCESYYWNGNTYFVGGTYSAGPFTNAVGCDSIAYLNLTLTNTTISSLVVEACEFYSWNGTTYTEEGIYYAGPFPNENGCDSIAILELSISQYIETDITVSACGSYTWEGTTYTASGEYVTTISNGASCAEQITLHLTILHQSADFNEDGYVNIIDVSHFISGFGCGAFDECFDERYDLNCDNAINILDASILVSVFATEVE